MSTQVAQANRLTVYYGTDATRAGTSTGAGGERLPISNLVSCDVTFNQETDDANNRDSNRWRETILSTRMVDISASGKLDTLIETSTTHRTINDLRGQIIAGDILYVEAGVGNSRLQGSFRVISLNLTQDTNVSGDFSLELESNGEVTWDEDVSS